jgi:hypothetical protein
MSGRKLTSFTELRKRNTSCAHHPAIDTERTNFCLHKACTNFDMRHPMAPRNWEDDRNNCKTVNGTNSILLKQTGAQNSGLPPTG